MGQIASLKTSRVCYFRSGLPPCHEDQVALYVHQPAEHGNHQPPGATICLTMANSSKVERAKRWIRVTAPHVAGSEGIQDLTHARRQLTVIIPRLSDLSI